MSSLTITAKFKILPTDDQIHPLLDTTKAIKQACNYASDVIFDQQCLVQSTLHKVTYWSLIQSTRLNNAQNVVILKDPTVTRKRILSNAKHVATPQMTTALVP